jgi:integral membrane sensor domain MASE1
VAAGTKLAATTMPKSRCPETRTIPPVLRRFLLNTSPRCLFEIAFVFAAYFLAGKIGLNVPFTSGNVSPVWPAAGIALVAMLLIGYRVWPAIALGAFFVNFFSPIPHAAALGIALGNAAGPLTSDWLLRRLPGFRPSHSPPGRA